MGSAAHPEPTRERLVVKSSFDELERVVDAAQAFFSKHSDDVDLLHRAMLLTSEAVTNGMKHGNRLVEEKEVAIDFVYAGSRLEVWVEDEGDGFRREDIPDPLASEHLLEEGGRGIFLIEKMADDVIYESGGRRIGIVFRTDSA